MWSEYIKLLRDIGFTEYEAKAYIALVALGSATIREISELSKVPASKLYEILPRLEERGWIFSITNRPIRYIARDPEEVISALKLKYEYTFNILLARLKHIWNSARSFKKVVIVRGLPSIVRRIRALLNDASRSIKLVIDDCSIWIDYGLINTLKMIKDKKLEIRVLINPDCKYINYFDIILDQSSLKISDRAKFLCIVRDSREVLKGVSHDEPIIVMYNVPEIVNLIDEFIDYLWTSNS